MQTDYLMDVQKEEEWGKFDAQNEAVENYQWKDRVLWFFIFKARRYSKYLAVDKT